MELRGRILQGHSGCLSAGVWEFLTRYRQFQFLTGCQELSVFFFFFFKCPWEQRKMFSVLSEGHSSPALSCCQKLALSDSCQISLCERTVRGEERAELRDTLLTPTRLFYRMFPTRCARYGRTKQLHFFGGGTKKCMSNCEGVMPWWTGWGIFSFSIINSKNRDFFMFSILYPNVLKTHSLTLPFYLSIYLFSILDHLTDNHPNKLRI